MLTNEKKNHNKSGEIHTDEEDLLKNNVLLHEENTKPSPTTKVKSFSKSSTKQSKPMERKEQNTESVSTSKQRNNQSKEKSVTILSDSKVKHLNGYEISCKLPSKCNVYVSNFPGANTRRITDYLKPSLRENPDHFIFHARTNDMNSERFLQLIAKSFIGLAASVKNENHDGSISNIIARADNQELREKTLLVMNFQRFVDKKVCI